MNPVVELRQKLAVAQANLDLMRSILELQTDSRFQALQKLMREQMGRYDHTLGTTKDHDELMRTQGKKQVIRTLVSYPSRMQGLISATLFDIQQMQKSLQRATYGESYEERASQSELDRANPRGGYGLEQGRYAEVERGAPRG